MKSLANLQAFLQVARHKSFTGASQALGLSASAVSKAVQRLEDDLHLKLVHRTTRKLSLTDDGERLFGRASELLDELETLEAEMSHSQIELTGRIRLNFPSTLGRIVLAQPVARFLQRYPRLEAEVRFEDRIIDLAEQGVDVAVRTGDLADSTHLIVTGFFRYQTVLCASPSFLERVGRPNDLDELLRLPAVGFAVRSRPPRPWRLQVGEETKRIAVQPYLVLEDLGAMAEAVAVGAGIALLPSWSCLDALREGRLIEVLPRLRPPSTQVWLVYHDRRHPAPKIRLFVDEMKELSDELTARYSGHLFTNQ